MTLLLVTAGNTDLQVVIRDQGIQVRARPGGLRGLHEALLEAPVRDTQRKGWDGQSWIIDESSADLPPYGQHLDIAPSDADPLCDSQGRLRLVPAKLVPRLAEIGAIDAAVVFASRREAAHAPSEPVAVGPVVAGWLQGRMLGKVDRSRELALERIEPWDPDRDPWPGGARWVNLLQGSERLEADDDTRPVRRECLTRLHRALQRLASETRPRRVVIAPSGGFPALKDVLCEAAALLFPAIEVSALPERAGRPFILSEGGALAPERGYRLRRAALSRIRRGDVGGAAGFAEEARGDPWEAPWAEPVLQAARWFGGSRPSVPNSSALFPCTTIDARCFLPGARADTALRGDRILDAVVSSVTFFDAALVDLLEIVAQGTYDDVLDELSAPQMPPALRDTLSDKGRWGWKLGKKRGELFEAILQIASPEQRAAFGSLHAMLGPCRAYRNAAVHGRLLGSHVEAARDTFIRQGIWAPSPHLRFLWRHGPAAAVLQALGHGGAPQRLESLFGALEDAILTR